MCIKKVFIYASLKTIMNGNEKRNVLYAEIFWVMAWDMENVIIVLGIAKAWLENFIKRLLCFV
jgi:hypothetical protein